MRLFLVRHGETAWNRDRRIQGARSNTPLNETGYEQADRLAAVLKKQGLDAVYSSPLKRAVDTAEVIAKECKVPLVVVPEFREIDAGELDGLSTLEMGNHYATFWADWSKGDPSTRLPNGESLEELQKRAWWAMERILEKHVDGGVVSVVAHMFTNMVIIARALDLDLRNVLHLRQDSAAISVIEFSARRHVLALLNDTCHLKG